MKSHTGINSQLYSFKSGHLVHHPFLGKSPGLEDERLTQSHGGRRGQEPALTRASFISAEHPEHAGTIPPPALIRQHHEGNNRGSCLWSIPLVPGTGYILYCPHLIWSRQPVKGGATVPILQAGKLRSAS